MAQWLKAVALLHEGLSLTPTHLCEKLGKAEVCNSCPGGQRQVDPLWPASPAVKAFNSVKAQLCVCVCVPVCPSVCLSVHQSAFTHTVLLEVRRVGPVMEQDLFSSRLLTLISCLAGLSNVPLLCACASDT